MTHKWKPGDCAGCGDTPEDLAWHNDEKPVALVLFHGDMICPDCLEEERAMEAEDAKNGIKTLWFDEHPEQAAAALNATRALVVALESKRAPGGKKPASE